MKILEAYLQAYIDYNNSDGDDDYFDLMDQLWYQLEDDEKKMLDLIISWHNSFEK